MTDKKKLTAEELFAQLTDPAIIQVAAQRLGMKLVSGESKKEDPNPDEELAKIRPKPLALGEDAKLGDLINAINKMRDDLVQYVDTTVNTRTGEVKKTLTSRDAESRKATIAAAIAAAKEEIGEENLAKIMPTWNAMVKGGTDIKEAYAKAKAAEGIKGKVETNKKDQQPVNRNNAVRSDESPDDDEVTLKPTKNVKQAASRNLDKLIAAEGDEWLNPNESEEALVHSSAEKGD